MKYAPILAAGLFLAGCDTATTAASADLHSQAVTSADYGDRWPFTVESGTVACEPVSAAVFRTGGKTYQLNGMAAQKGYPDIAPLWRDNPDVPGTKINIGPMIDLALSLCGK